MTKNYVKGNAKKVTTKYGEIINVSLNLKDLERLPQEKGYVKLTIAERKSADEYGNTHYIYLNDYKPQPREEIVEEDDSLPF